MCFIFVRGVCGQGGVVYWTAFLVDMTHRPTGRYRRTPSTLHLEFSWLSIAAVHLSDSTRDQDDTPGIPAEYKRQQEEFAAHRTGEYQPDVKVKLRSRASKKIVVTVINACALYSTHDIHTIYKDDSSFASVVNWWNSSVWYEVRVRGSNRVHDVYSFWKRQLPRALYCLVFSAIRREPRRKQRLDNSRGQKDSAHRCGKGGREPAWSTYFRFELREAV